MSLTLQYTHSYSFCVLRNWYSEQLVFCGEHNFGVPSRHVASYLENFEYLLFFLCSSESLFGGVRLCCIYFVNIY